MKQAIEAFHHAARLKPGMLVPHLFLGLEYVKLKRFSEAIPHFKQAALVETERRSSSVRPGTGLYRNRKDPPGQRRICPSR